MLTIAGWVFVGSGPNVDIAPEGHVDIGFYLEDVKSLDLHSANLMTINLGTEEFDQNPEQLSGWTVSEDNLDGGIVLLYEGPVDESFMEVVNRMITMMQSAS